MTDLNIKLNESFSVQVTSSEDTILTQKLLLVWQIPNRFFKSSKIMYHNRAFLVSLIPLYLRSLDYTYFYSAECWKFRCTFSSYSYHIK